MIQFKGRRENSYDPVKLSTSKHCAKFESRSSLLSQAKLHERVKELTCLYGIARAARSPDFFRREDENQSPCFHRRGSIFPRLRPIVIDVMPIRHLVC